MTQPNILFVITDQQRAADTGFMGNQVVRTPNMDRIANAGMVFENAWVANPVCMPNRSSIMTGRMPTSHGCVFNDRSLEPNVNTFVRQFRKAGYRTGLIGKSHLQHGISRNSMVPFRGEGESFSPYQNGWDEVEDFERYLNGRPEDPADFYGFSHVEFSLEHGARVGGHHLNWAMENGGAVEDLVAEYDASARGNLRSDNWWQIYQPPYNAELHSTSFVTQQTMKFIDTAERQSKPWLAWCSFPDPHHPMTPPGEWFHRHKPEDMILPESRHDRLEDAPAHLQAIRKTHPRDQRNWVAPTGYGDDDNLLREAIAATYGTIEMIDDGVGQILDQLESLGVRENTIVVFTSDHGDMMGEHGLFLKGFIHYRGTLQVPMVIDAPGKSPGRTGSLSSSLDLGVTLMDLCDLKPYAGIQGRSLLPTLEDSDAVIREHVLVEDDLPDVTAKLTPFPGKTRTVITQDYRFTRNIKGEEQLFDLRADPGEMKNLSKWDQAGRAEMMERLAVAMMEADDTNRGAPATG
jgi:arylsulfatase A-like enzyme